MVRGPGKFLLEVACAVCCVSLGFAQGPAPLYRVTIVEQGIVAVAYPYASEPSRIDFRGTALLPDAKGDASVQVKQGRTEIHAKFDKLSQPSRFGPGYLTYVFWAISPEGRAHNLGEIVTGTSNHGRLEVTTGLSAFAMMVTAEPYAAVRDPSELVVLKNQVRPDTGGKTIPVQLQPDLMKRGTYTWQIQAQPQAAPERKVSMSRYEALLELHQAQNAMALARAANAERYAAESFNAAQSALSEAQQLESSKADPKAVIQNARQAEQAADEARAIAGRKNTAAPPVTVSASAPLEHAAPVSTGEAGREALTSPLSTSLHRQVDGSLLSQDTPRGVIIILPDKSFDGSDLLTSASQKLGPLASTLLSHPGIHVQVDGYTDSGELQSWERAQTVRNLLIGAGLSTNQISIRGGVTMPSNRTPDRRVQIVISEGP